uniref:NADH dehydrogenase subunit 3 n=1 Tax=Blasticotoma filiceti TaxID=1141352 RepID=UPI00220DA8F5|nr:NADH dehydrogenase subunit 3 [Blasticotoma filiceti]UXW93444.1 NADH dehydrogenase subunit 3 [Blasticotoma filiceti]
MKLITILTLITCSLPLLIMILTSLISKKSYYDREKSSPFECGFDPKGSSRMPLSIQFFMITIIFLIFDVEISLILPIIVTLNNSNMAPWLTSITIFIIILLMGLYYEWNYGSLNWYT